MTGEAERMAQMWRWLEAVCAELGIDPELLDGVTDDLLGLVRDVAHGPSRPGAPLTAFLVGLAAGRASPKPDPAVVADRVAAVERLAASWSAR
ncbi:DUF6457 domain-containing protein [Georgenia sp. H159]|uniref:DUF6457 domain-containing protein n=1 Tax=Georgenia sp. H159 TaxID=3076115 RepID=UPI002D78350D|nr:DUF6457 domain-containing protein [Georgenia sp. H159]